MTHFIICDNEIPQQAHNRELLEAWAQSRGLAIKVSCFASAEAFLFHYEVDKSVDVLLLDIQMEAMDGVSLARELRKGNKEVQIIFITGYMDYILDGYEVEALHYLLKPVTKEKLSPVLDRALTRLSDHAKVLFVGAERVPLYDVRFLEVQGNYVTVHAVGAYKLKATLSQLETELDRSFLRIGRSYIVNLKRIQTVGKSELTLTDGMKIPLPRGGWKLVNQAIIERL